MAEGNGKIGPQILRKIAAKFVVGKLTVDLIPAGKDQIDLFTCYGVAHNIKQGESTYGTWTALVGDFIAVSHLTGEEFRSIKAFLPEVVTLPVQNALVESKNPVQFAVVIGITRNQREPDKKYDFTVKALEKPRESDQLMDMRNRFTPQLEAKPQTPATSPNPAPAVKETAKKKK